MDISIKERHQALRRAKQGLKHLTEHPRTTRNRLGAARDQLNLVYSLRDAREVWDSVQGIETSVLEVYGGIPGQIPGEEIVGGASEVADELEAASTRVRSVR